MRRGLITSRGTGKHDKLVASVVKFLIKKCNISPLSIETEKEFETTRGKTYIDVFYKDKLIECVASVGGISGNKLDDLVYLKRKLILAFSHNIEIKSISQRLIYLIRGILLFDVEKEELTHSFSNFDEYLAYVLVVNPAKTVEVNL